MCSLCNSNENGICVDDGVGGDVWIFESCLFIMFILELNWEERMFGRLLFFINMLLEWENGGEWGR